MKINSWLKITILVLVLLAAFTAGTRTALAEDKSLLSDEELAEKYAPVLYFHPAEIFRPQAVTVMLDHVRLRQQRDYWFDINLLNQVSIVDLSRYRAPYYFLDVWYGSKGISESTNYSSHRSYYQAALSPESGGPPVTVYAHITRDEVPGKITIQYWLFYYYNDWFNKHEGDWEMVQVMLGEDGGPEWVTLSQHHGGTRRTWSSTQIEDSTHPVVYVALGSHANYFWGDENYPNGQNVGNERVEIMDRTGSAGWVIPELILLPEQDQAGEIPAGWTEMEWLLFAGHWGETAPQGDFGGPFGPAVKDEQWNQPYTWGMAQPLDLDTWYHNRLRLELIGESTQNATINLTTDGGALPPFETNGGIALLHGDLPPGANLTAEIMFESDVPFSLVATLPEPENSQVTHYRYDNLTTEPFGKLAINWGEGELSIRNQERLPLNIKPAYVEVETAIWDAPDIVWVASFLPASDVVRGILISLLAGVIPTLLYVGIVYWSDRYEKEPLSLLAAALLWGAIPALLVATIARLFFHLPVELLGPEAIDALRAGAVTPLLEETLKGLIIVFIAWRYRQEFDNVQDGIIYGAMVGFGFSMTGNIVSYLGSFLLRGFAGLSSAIIMEGLVYGFNHALYSAIFGAGLGYARLSQNRMRKWGVPVIAFLLAVVFNAVHNLLIQNALGFNIFTVIITWLGLLGAIGLMLWSLKQQQRTLEKELVDELDEALYQEVISLRHRRRVLFQTLRQEGFKSWRQKRRVYQLCAELAFKKMDDRKFPGERGLSEAVSRLRNEIQGR